MDGECEGVERLPRVLAVERSSQVPERPISVVVLRRPVDGVWPPVREVLTAPGGRLRAIGDDVVLIHQPERSRLGEAIVLPIGAGTPRALLLWCPTLSYRLFAPVAGRRSVLVVSSRPTQMAGP